MRDAIDISFGDFHPFLNAMDQGVLITDAVGHIIFCNDYHRKMDGLDKKDIIGKKVLDVYDLDIQSSPLMRVLQTRKALHNITHIYEAKNGKFVNSITNAFPIIKNEKLMGAISFVKEYEYLDGLLSTVDGSHKRSLVVSATRFSFKDIIGKAPLLRKTINKAKMAANSLSPIMLFGKTGTGKELFAQSIHNYSHRRKKNYMAVNCAAIPETLLEGILFGSTKGAFTGAMEKPGLFEQANGGTIFLDEINSMPIGLQGKLLRVLQEKKVRRVGAQHEIPLDLKVISSTNRHPAKAIEDGNLRRDLFYRIGVVFLTIPSLKDRAEDMGALMEHFIKKYNQLMDKNVTRISDRILSFF